MHIYKTPWKEDNNFYFVIEPKDTLVAPVEDNYYQQKRMLFRKKMDCKSYLEEFSDRPSLRGVDAWGNIRGSVYTLSAIDKNQTSFDTMIDMIKERKDVSRRCVIRLADSFSDYMDDNINTSCLNIIHFYKDKVNLFFRASDMRYELLIDLHLIKEFFIDPVYGEKPYYIHVSAATAQNIIPIQKLFIV